MILAGALLVFFIDAFDITLITCDAQWMDKGTLEQIIGAEISELTEQERSGMILVVDRCTDKSVRLRVSDQKGQRERVMNIEAIPQEALLRTIALALSELCRQTDFAENPNAEPNPTPQSTDPQIPIAPSSKSKTRDDFVNLKRSRKANVAATEDEYRISIGAYLRWFPVAATFAPEIRFGVHKRRWRIELGGYGMGWDSNMAETYLVAITSTAGPTLLRYRGTISVGLDVLAELGVVAAYGKANYNADETPRFNIAAGGHLAFWIGLGNTEGFQPRLDLDFGWLRGLNLFVDDAFQGGFEGPCMRLGLVATW